ncbi:MAG: N-6 DNA methylase, partial [Candidatus Rokubacteria bacterium]|nr:N-6 DNA methylase [Candidatus Rokubacteria bacterium]
MHEAHHLRDELELVSICAALGAARVGGPLSRAERRLLHRASRWSRPGATTIEAVRAAVQGGADPLGDFFTALRPQESRRATGAFYTPPGIVNAMLVWVLEHGPDRIVDPGCGSGRFVVAARRLGFKGELIAVDIDPLATLMTRAHCAAAHTGRVRVIHGDFLRLALGERRQSRTAVVGNPPYVRHHALSTATKRWARSMGARLGVRVSGLAGLHTLFILGAARLAQPGDIGCFITSAEWLDVRYGDAARGLLAGHLGCVRLDILDPNIAAFGNAMSTAAIVSWEAGNPSGVCVRHVHEIEALGTLSGGATIGRDRLLRSGRWSELLRPARIHGDLVPL